MVFSASSINFKVFEGISDFFFGLDWFTSIVSKRLSFFLDIEYRRFSGEYLNKKIVITGTFGNFSRKYIEDKLKVEGAKITSTVSKKVDFIIVGRDSGSKLHKAKKLNIKIEDEDFVIKLMKN